MPHHFTKILRRGFAGGRLLSLAGLWLAGAAAVLGQTESASPRRLALDDCIQAALLGNRALQIERLNPAIARATLDSSYGYYDPIFLADARRENLSDSGGFDPADFSRDAIYEAESHVVQMGVTGVLPSGMSYSLVGDYANSFGLRNDQNFDSYNVQAGIFVQQPLLKNFWIDQGRLTIQVNKRNLRITELGVVYLAMTTINLVQQGYHDLLFALGSQKVQQGLLKTRQTFLASVRRQIDGGLLTALDEKVAQAQVATVEAELISCSNAVVLAENQLLNLMGHPFTNRVRTPLLPAEGLLVVPEKVTFPESATQGLARRPDLAQLREDVEKAVLDLKFRRNQLFPSLDVVAGYGRRGADTMQRPTWYQAQSASMTKAFDQIWAGDNPNDMIGVIFSLPLSRTAERANYRVSRQLKSQSELRVKQIEEQILREISDAIDTVQSGLDRVHATRRAIEAAQAALEAEEKKLAGGKSSIMFVLQLQADLAKTQTAEVEARADYNKALSQLHFSEGTLLDRKHVSIEFK